MAKSKANPDHLLAPEQFPELNKAFYATKPWEYFNYRNQLLILAAGAGDSLEEIATQGVSYKGLTYQQNARRTMLATRRPLRPGRGSSSPRARRCCIMRARLCCAGTWLTNP